MKIIDKVKHAGFLLLMLMSSSCDDFVKIDPPRTALVKSVVFESNSTAEAAVVDIYYQLRTSAFASGDILSVSYLMSQSSDEQVNYFVGSPTTTEEFRQVSENGISPSNSIVLKVWTDLYKVIYKANAVIEGLESSNGVSDGKKRQLVGEAKFMRAFCHFYLANIWGDVPLVTSTDYRANSKMPRTSSAKVYQQIIQDLEEAQSLLPDGYASSNDERVRVNRHAATALLARSYLYSGDWANAEARSSSVINATGDHELVGNLSEVSVKNNKEALWQLWTDYYPSELFTFYIFSVPYYGALREQYADSFEVGDKRRDQWVGSVASGAETFLFSKKYSSFVQAEEYSTILRLAEQYLIRAEARAHQGNVAGAQSDVNVIRHRAGLGDTPANSQEELLTAVEQERKSELFNEWGHRWFDLKRTNRVDAVLSSIKAQWTPTAVLFPIPESEMINNEGLKNAQNPGY